MANETEVELSGVAPERKHSGGAKRVGGRALRPSTLMMGHGYDPMLSEGALKPPIFLTSTFVFPNAAAGKRHFEGVTGIVRAVPRASSTRASTARTRRSSRTGWESGRMPRTRLPSRAACRRSRPCSWR